ncbi:hypothetical protein B0H10DRAFT_1946469 [Mycena sp. CBHHK59/15]|nr:hypothetical protein B0H10DRAFT_1946469 [Mycena sp. CBHHK59/15]
MSPAKAAQCKEEWDADVAAGRATAKSRAKRSDAGKHNSGGAGDDEDNGGAATKAALERLKASRRRVQSRPIIDDTDTEDGPSAGNVQSVAHAEPAPPPSPPSLSFDHPLRIRRAPPPNIRAPHFPFAFFTHFFRFYLIIYKVPVLIVVLNTPHLILMFLRLIPTRKNPRAVVPTPARHCVTTAINAVTHRRRVAGIRWDMSWLLYISRGTIARDGASARARRRRGGGRGRHASHSDQRCVTPRRGITAEMSE